MKLSRTWKVILTVLMIVSALLSVTAATAGLYCYESGYYYSSHQGILKNYYDNMLKLETESFTDELGKNINVWSEERTLEYIQDFTDRTGIRVYVNYNTKPFFKNLISEEATYEYIISGRYYTNGKRLSVMAHLDVGASEYATKLYYLTDFLFPLRYGVWIIAGIGAVILFVTSMLLVITAGVKKGSEEIQCSKLLKKMPYSILLLLFAALILGITFVFFSLDRIQYFNSFDLWFYCIPLYIVILWLIAVWLLCLTVKKFRTKTFWNTGILYRTGSFLGNKLFAPIKAKCSYLWKNLNLWWKAGLLFAGQLILSGFLLLFYGIACDEGAKGWIVLFVLGWFMLQSLLGGATFITVINLQKLKSGALRIKEGGLSEKIDTDQMYWEFKQHAETLNTIGDGVKVAVAEQMKSERFQTELITNVSHDIKTPMTSIINYVDLLDKCNLSDPTAKEYIEVLIRQSNRLKKLTEDLVEASKAQSGALTPILENVNLTTLLSQACGEYADRFEEKALITVLRLPQNEIYLTADSRMLWRIMDNLLSNISKYALTGTRVYIDLAENGTLTLRNISREEITVADEELTRRFVRGDASRGLSSGSGLGLSIALSLTELMNGSLKVHTDGDLFKVTLTLPLGQKPEPPSEFPNEI